MRDSTRPGLIPPGTPVVAGYVDGEFAWTEADWALFPQSVALGIATQPRSSADILDVEQGDAVPDDVPGWIARFNRPGRRAPTIYCNRSNWTACRVAAGSARVDWWISTLDGTTSVPGAVAVQYVDYGTYDESTILDPAWVGMEDMMGYMAAGPATGGDLVARRVQIHEWVRAATGKPISGEAQMDQLLAIWVSAGGEAVYAELFGA